MTCICPSDKYTCSADNVAKITWDSNNANYEDFITISYSSLDNSESDIVNRYGLQVHFLRTDVIMFLANFTSHLVFIEPENWNGSKLTCEAKADQDTADSFQVNICLTGEYFMNLVLLLKTVFHRSSIITY